jgi:hypothetical protein
LLPQTLLLLQADLETRMGAIAALHARSKDVQVVLLCDRGVLDGKAFCETEEEWQMILDAAETTEGAILQRYDMVCHLVTAAKGAAEHYEYGATSRNPSRFHVRASSQRDTRAPHRPLPPLLAFAARDRPLPAPAAACTPVAAASVRIYLALSDTLIVCCACVSGWLAGCRIRSRRSRRMRKASLAGATTRS